MITHDQYYKIYKSGAEYRRTWENKHIPLLEKHFKTFENARSVKISELSSALNGLVSYEGYNLTPIVQLSQSDSEGLFKALQSKYNFVLKEITDGVERIKFVSRATISEKDPSTNMFFSADLGLFETIIAFSDHLQNSPKNPRVREISSRPVGENNPKTIPDSGGTCYHPHINGSYSLCLGSYGKSDGALIEDCKTYNILGIMYNLCALLCRYNPNSLNYGGAYINNWLGHKCAICFEFAPSAVTCEKSKQKIHKECAEEIDGKYYGLDQIKKCSKCGNRSPFYIAYSRDNIICSSCEEKES